MSKYSGDMGSLWDCLEEECLEIAIELSKMRRFGAEGNAEWMAAGNKSPLENAVQELGDLFVIVDMLQQRKMITSEQIQIAKKNKRDKLYENFGVTT